MTATSASKSFNIPGTKCAQVLLTNPADREMWAERAEWSEHQTATIGAIATTTAYNEGDPWFQDALSYVRRNLGLFDEQMSTRFSGVAIFAHAARISHGWISARSALTIRPRISLRRRRWR